MALTDTIPSDDEHVRPDGVDDKTIAALGKVSEMLETIERARGHLYEFHQLIGHADLGFDRAVELLREAGLDAEADELQAEIIGRNVQPGKWSFQMVEGFNDTYYSVVKAYEQKLRDTHLQGRRHIFESEMKEKRRSHGRPGHEAR